MSPSTPTPWSAFLRTLWWKANSAAPQTVHSHWEPRWESRPGRSWRTWGQCWGRTTSRMSRRTRRDWCPASPLAICPRGPWWKNDKRRGHEEKKFRWGKRFGWGESHICWPTASLSGSMVPWRVREEAGQKKKPSSGNIRQKRWTSGYGDREIRTTQGLK